MLGELTPESGRRVRRGGRAGDWGSPLISAELRHLGGALARRTDDGGALGTIDGAFAFFGAGVVVDEAWPAPSGRSSTARQDRPGAVDRRPRART